MIRNIETFAAGDYPGDEPGEVWSYSDDDVKRIVKNFAVLSSGANPLHHVPVVVTHDDAHAYAWVNGARMSGDVLVTDWGDVEPSLRHRIKARRLLKVSPEIKRDFVDKDGKVYPGPYLYRVAVLGADVPRVKGLADLPERFSDKRPGHRVKRTFRFAEQPMDRTAAIQFLQQQGVDPSLLTDAVPDAVICGIAMAWQDQNGANGGGSTPDTREHADDDDMDQDPTLHDDQDEDEFGNRMQGSRDYDDRTQVDDPEEELGWEGDPDDETDMKGFQRYRDRGRARRPGKRPAKKVTVTRQFADPRSIAGMINRAVAKAMGVQGRKVTKALKRQQDATRFREVQERQQAVRLFCDQKKKEGKLSPADCDETAPVSVLSRLLRIAAQPQKVHRFADPSNAKKQIAKSELQLQMDEIDGREVRRFAERVRGQAGTTASGNTPADPHRARLESYYKEQTERYNRATAGRN